MTMIRQSPRLTAVQILTRVETSGAFAEPLLDRCLSRWPQQDPRDRGLITELVYGTLRMRGFLDGILAQFLRRGLARTDILLRNVLRTALYQLFFTDRIPAHAAVHEAVALAGELCPGRDALVNAVLRSVQRRRERLALPDRRTEFRSYAAFVHSHPPWLIDRWERRWGQEETLALCRANNTSPRQILRVNRLQSTREKVIEELFQEGIRTEKTPYSPAGLVVMSAEKPLRETIPYRRGMFQLQDEASQLIGSLVAPAAGETVLDLCAGMGGKTTHLGELMDNRGRIFAVERQKGKLRQLRGLAARLGIQIITTLAADATLPLPEPPPGSCDRVLVDVPCSGLGTLRRCPEIKWRLTPEQLDRLPGLQKRLLERAGDYVKPGGRLIYSTCSVMAEENEEVVMAFLECHREFRPAFPKGLPPDLLDEQGFLRTFPHRQGTDGFFGAVLEKKG